MEGFYLIATNHNNKIEGLYPTKQQAVKKGKELEAANRLSYRTRSSAEYNIYFKVGYKVISANSAHKNSSEVEIGKPLIPDKLIARINKKRKENQITTLKTFIKFWGKEEGVERFFSVFAGAEDDVEDYIKELRTKDE
jgi:hypothetical protein